MVQGIKMEWPELVDQYEWGELVENLLEEKEHITTDDLVSLIPESDLDATREALARRGIEVLDASEVTGEAEAGTGLQSEPCIEQLRTVEEGVAVKPAEPRELGLFEPWDCAKHAQLLAMLELRLEADHAP